jgi:hypothetical protein
MAGKKGINHGDMEDTECWTTEDEATEDGVRVVITQRRGDAKAWRRGDAEMRIGEVVSGKG